MAVLLLLLKLHSLIILTCRQYTSRMHSTDTIVEAYAQASELANTQPLSLVISMCKQYTTCAHGTDTIVEVHAQALELLQCCLAQQQRNLWRGTTNRG